MANLTIVYGTGGGNTELVCEKIAEVLSKKHSVSLLRAKSTKPEDLKNWDVLVLASPTYGHGLLEQYMDRFLHLAKDWDLKGRKLAVIGLGDKKYDEDYLIEAAKTLTEFAKEHGAEIVLAPLMIAKNPLPQLATRVQSWAEELSKRIA